MEHAISGASGCRNTWLPDRRIAQPHDYQTAWRHSHRSAGAHDFQSTMLPERRATGIHDYRSARALLNSQSTELYDCQTIRQPNHETARLSDRKLSGYQTTGL